MQESSDSAKRRLPQIAKSNDGIYVHGARSYDNNFELDGISVSDVQGSSAGSGGIPIPNPDTIEEFKVQTGLYDAAFGRYGGGQHQCNHEGRQQTNITVQFSSSCETNVLNAKRVFF